MYRRQEAREPARVLPSLLRGMLAGLDGGIQDETVGGQESEKQEQQQSCPQAQERQPGGPFAELVVEPFVHQIFP